jgi:hypothetical protein
MTDDSSSTNTEEAWIDVRCFPDRHTGPELPEDIEIGKVKRRKKNGVDVWFEIHNVVGNCSAFCAERN